MTLSVFERNEWSSNRREKKTRKQKIDFLRVFEANRPNSKSHKIELSCIESWSHLSNPNRFLFVLKIAFGCICRQMSNETKMSCWRSKTNRFPFAVQTQSRFGPRFFWFTFICFFVCSKSFVWSLVYVFLVFILLQIIVAIKRIKTQTPSASFGFLWNNQREIYAHGNVETMSQTMANQLWIDETELVDEAIRHNN